MKHIGLLLVLALLLGAAAAAHHRHGRPQNGLIAYSSNRTGTFQIWATDPTNPSSSAKALTSLEQGFQLAAHPAWSPDGTQLAFTGMQDGSLNVWIRGADGSFRQMTHSVAPIISMVPAWTPDSKRIVFESNRAVPPAESTAADPYDLYSVDALTGGELQRLTVSADSRTGGMGGKPSPCGRYLAFASDRDLSLPQGMFDLYLMRLGLDGLPISKNGQQEAPKRLTKGVANQFSRSWSPNSKRLVLNSQVGWTGTAADKVGAGQIITVELGSGRKHVVTPVNDRYPALVPGGVFPALRGDVTPAWSPDGRRIAFASQSHASGDFEIVTVRTDGRDRQVLTGGLHEQHVTVAWQPVFV